MICLVWEWGHYGTLSLDFLCWPRIEILGETKFYKRLPGMSGLRTGFGLGPRNRTLLSILHSGP